ncbi:hypothetical protein [Brevibacillus fulvus]|uniref:Nucleic acid-binding Zn-ribbon protein n=1 Tax=Brevibacillus fulvus TaxID=1125967 RepID=A0A939BN72_9BACL|nr:hypothetical protein [Brevibacillus fulvus]MBM7588510.1 putative nucleic acid-binding Zn-ribbon protein [Brevibacillus fulvus]
MANQEITQMINQMDSTLAAVNQMSMTKGALFASELNKISKDIQAVTDRLNSPRFSGNKQTVESTRKQLVAIRIELDDLRNKIGQSQSTLANVYRNAIGEEKEQFEQATATEQQMNNPLAYQSLQAYRDENELTDMLDRLNTQLLDLDHALAKTTYSSVVPAPTTGKAPNFDNDPPPPTVSP